MNTHERNNPHDEQLPEDVRAVDGAVRRMAHDDASIAPAGFDDRVWTAVRDARTRALEGGRAGVVATIGRGTFMARTRVWAIAAAALLATTLTIVALLPGRATANGMSAEEAALLIELDTWLASAASWRTETALDYEIESLSEDIASLAAGSDADWDAVFDLYTQGDPL